MTMRLGGERESENVEDRRGGGFSGIGIAGGGIGTIAIIVVGLLFGVDPSALLQILGGDGDSTEQPAPAASRAPSAAPDDTKRFVAVVLAETEDTWSGVFRRL